MRRFRPFNVLTMYTLSSVIKIGLATAILASLMLVGVDLFSHLDSYISHNVSFGQAFFVSLLYFPEAFLLALGPSFLFSVTYFLSMLTANNEMICVLNSGLSMRRVVVPCVLLAVVLSFGYFVFNENIAIEASNLKDTRSKALTSSSSSLDNSNIALSDMQDGYMIYAGQFVNETSTLYNVSYVEILEEDSSGSSFRRVDAYMAQYDESAQLWTLHDCYEYLPTSSDLSLGDTVQVTYYDSLEIPRMQLEPQLFRNLSSEISKMSLDLARAYVLRMKSLNPDEYAHLGTEYYKRIFSCLTPLIMIIIACSMNYRFKKNVLFFSLICSICVAVVYFVVQMVTIMLADQGVIAPYLGTLIPFAVVLLLASIMSAVLKS